MANSVISAAKVQGTSVRNSADESLGKIEDVVIDKQSGRIVYAVLSFGGFLGLGERHFAIPWEALRYSPQLEAYQLDIDKETLERAPGYESGNEPDMSDQRWGEQIYTYYGYDPYWTDTARDAETARRRDLAS